MNQQHDPGLALHREVRAGFIRKGSTFGEWCRQEGVNPSSARQVVIGSWDGPKARALRARIIKAAGLEKAA